MTAGFDQLSPILCCAYQLIRGTEPGNSWSCNTDECTLCQVLCPVGDRVRSTEYLVWAIEFPCRLEHSDGVLPTMGPGQVNPGPSSIYLSVKELLHWRACAISTRYHPQEITTSPLHLAPVMLRMGENSAHGWTFNLSSYHYENQPKL